MGHIAQWVGVGHIGQWVEVWDIYLSGQKCGTYRLVLPTKLYVPHLCPLSYMSVWDMIGFDPRQERLENFLFTRVNSPC